MDVTLTLWCDVGRCLLQVYLAEDAKREMGLWREDLVALAYFLGSDYTEGVNGVGIVNAAEIIHAFPMHGHTVREEEAQLRRGGGIGGSAEDIADGPLRGLRRFKDWLHGYNFEGELFGNASGARDTHSTGDTGNAQDRMVSAYISCCSCGDIKLTVTQMFVALLLRWSLQSATAVAERSGQCRSHSQTLASRGRT